MSTYDKTKMDKMNVGNWCQADRKQLSFHNLQTVHIESGEVCTAQGNDFWLHLLDATSTTGNITINGKRPAHLINEQDDRPLHCQLAHHAEEC